MPRPLAEQVIVITGASSGIGRCAACYLAAQGARVVATARNADALDALVREIEGAGGRAISVPGDVTRDADLEAVARAALRHFGRIDTWINNAGVYIQGRAQDISLEEYRRTLEVDLLGVINGTRQALRPMLRQGSGVIIQVSSIVGRRGAPYTSAYAAAKAGVDGFCEALRGELWGTGIRVSVLYPPSVDTPIYQHARSKFGTVPKPAPPVEEPIRAARALAELAETGERARFFGLFRHMYLNLDSLSPTLTDWFLHHAVDFTRTNIPAGGDNLERPTATPSVRGGWAAPGWRGFTVRETVRVLPVETLLAAAALGFAAARLRR